MRVTFCWSYISGYMAACWRALAREPGVEVHVLAYRTDTGDIAFGDETTAGLSVRFLDAREREDAALVKQLVADSLPDVLVISGWASPAYRALAYEPALAPAGRIMTMDNPWLGTLRQRLGRYRMAGYLRRMDRVVVPGERAAFFARALGVPPHKIVRGMYAVEHAPLAPLYERRLALHGGWPRRFLFVGRYVQDKRVDVLLDAYRRYRATVSDPWPLTCCGQGPLRSLFAAAESEGVADRGFVQPADLPALYLEHGAFVLSSDYEPWGVVLAEAAAAGLPIVCTDACGASVEVVRGMFNGLVVPAGDAAALARAMKWVHDNHASLPEMGSRSRTLGEAFSDQAWLRRWMWMLRELSP